MVQVPMVLTSLVRDHGRHRNFGPVFKFNKSLCFAILREQVRLGSHERESLPH
jgi:hypothetical protein